MNYTVYYLLDEHKIPFYVGVSSNLMKRLARHKYEALYKNRCFNLPKSNKLRKVLRHNNIYDIVDIIEWDVHADLIDRLEQEHISKLRYKGIRLKNATDGGRDAVAHDNKLQRKAAKSRIGQKRSDETRKRLSKALKGVKKSEAHKRALSEAWKTRPPFSKKTLNKMRDSMLGKNTSKYKLVDPKGKVYIIDGLVKFCKTHGLTHSNICKVASGMNLHHKGWRAEKLVD